MPQDLHLSIQLIGGPTVLIEYGGIRIVTDPTFDEPGDYDVGGRTLTKLTPPALSPDDIGAVEAVLLSHHQHVDNLDRRGAKWLAKQRTVWTTEAAVGHLNHGKALHVWETTQLFEQSMVSVTGLPARHGPAGCEPLTGEVIGFLLEGEHLPTVYISGDNASLDAVSAIAARHANIDVAILFCGGAKTPLCDYQNLTLGSDHAVKAASILGSPIVVPAHFEGWSHFKEGAEELRRAFKHVPTKLCLLERGTLYRMFRTSG